jgi:hypothetical protein
MMTGVPASFDDFVAANGESLLRTAHLVTMDAGDAEDLVQECLLILAQRLVPDRCDGAAVRLRAPGAGQPGSPRLGEVVTPPG